MCLMEWGSESSSSSETKSDDDLPWWTYES
jgi:hypothetical protein